MRKRVPQFGAKHTPDKRVVKLLEIEVLIHEFIAHHIEQREQPCKLKVRGFLH